MARIGLLIIIIGYLTAGCTTVKGKIRLIDFDGISKSYEQVLLDSDFEAAKSFSNSRTIETEVDFAAYENVKIVEYQVKKGRVSSDNVEIRQTAKLKYYRTDSLVVRTIQYDQLWQYNDAKKTWILQTALPEFK